MSADTRAPRLPPATFDSVILAAVVAECKPLIGARVQRVHQAGSAALAITLRGRGRGGSLFASIHPRSGRLHLAREVEPTEATPFVLQLRNRLEGATLRSVTAPLFERVAVLGFEGLEGATDFIVEILGGNANFILCAEGRIIGADRIDGGGKATRPIVPRRLYVPPPQPRPTPETVSAADLIEAAARPASTRTSSADRPAWRTVMEAVGGIGRPLATEVCVRAGIDPYGRLSDSLAEAAVGPLREIADLVRAQRFSPVLYRDDAGAPIAYAPFPMQIYQTLESVPATMSAAVEAVSTHSTGVATIEETRASLAAAVTQARTRVQRALAAVDEEQRTASAAVRAREFGELILAYLSQITPGAQVLTVPDFHGEPVEIPLDPARGGVENAQAYFRRHTKARAALKRLPARRAELEAEGAFLASAATAIAQGDSLDDLWEVEQDLIAAGLRRRAWRGAKPKAVASGRAFELARGHVVRVGRSARENEHLTFEVAGPDDWWFHARGMPGAHVVLQTRGADPTEAAIQAAARVAAYYSAGRTSSKVAVAYTRRRFVRRLRGARPGQVQVAHEQTITVTPGLPSSVRGASGRTDRSARRG